MLTVSLVKDLSKYVDISGEYGTGFEINDFCDPCILDDEDEIRRIICEYRKVGIPKGSTMNGAFYDVLIHSRDEKIAEIGKFRMKQSMDIAKELGLCGVVFHVNYQPGIPGDIYRQNVIDKVSGYVEELLKEYKDINIYIENMFEDDVMVIKNIAERLSKYENFGICLDYAHAFVYGTDAELWVKELAPYLRHIHINDNDLKEDLHLPVGSGSIDWDRFLAYRKEVFPEASILIEVTSPDNQRQSLEFIRRNMGGNCYV